MGISPKPVVRTALQLDGSRRLPQHVRRVLQAVHQRRPALRRVRENGVRAVGPAASAVAPDRASSLQRLRSGRLQRVQSMLLKVDSRRTGVQRVLRTGVHGTATVVLPLS